MSTAPAPGSGFTQMLQQESLKRVRRIYRNVLVVALLVLVVVTPLTNVVVGGVVFAVMLAAAVLLLAGFVATEGLIAVASLAGVWVTTYLLVVSGAWSQHSPVTLTVVSLSLMAAVAPFAMPSYGESRGMTAVIAQLAVLLGGAVMHFDLVVGFVVGAAGVVAAVVSRGAGLVQAKAWRAKRRSHLWINPPARALPDKRRSPLDPTPAMSIENVRAGYEFEVKVAAQLATLGGRWKVMHSRTLPDSRADIDSLLVGPAGVVMVDAKAHHGRIEKVLQMPDVSADDDLSVAAMEPYEVMAYNGSTQWFADLVAPVAYESRKVYDYMRVGPDAFTAIICFGDGMTLDDPWVTVWVEGVPIILTTIDVVDMAIESLPQVQWRLPSKLAIRRYGEKAAEKTHEHYLEDLAAAADYMFPPR